MILDCSKPIFGVISEEARRMGVKAYVIGGYVRDRILGRPSTDIDVVVEGDGRRWPVGWERGPGRRWPFLRVSEQQ